MKEESRLPGVMRGCPPCKNCEERHTACHDKCPKYKMWKAEAQKVNDKRRAYEEEHYKDYELEWRRRSWGMHS